MFCIVLSGEDGNNKTAWRGRRSAEVLGYHHKEKTVEIVFGLYLENLKKTGQPNYLYILHPGNSEVGYLDHCWPLARHKDEITPDNHDSILHSIYKGEEGVAREAFSLSHENKLEQYQELSSWDSWLPIPHATTVARWPEDEKPESCSIEREFPKKYFDAESISNTFIPFTVFKFGPFTIEGPVIFNFTITLKGETYQRLVCSNPVFPVYGPDVLLNQIRNMHLDKSPEDIPQEDWLNQLKRFETYIPFGDSYDVILLNTTKVNPVSVYRKYGIIEAPIQPKSGQARRFITSNHGFGLLLLYSEETIKADIWNNVKKRYQYAIKRNLQVGVS